MKNGVILVVLGLGFCILFLILRIMCEVLDGDLGTVFHKFHDLYNYEF